jgi:hypothetical protein
MSAFGRKVNIRDFTDRTDSETRRAAKVEGDLEFLTRFTPDVNQFIETLTRGFEERKDELGGILGADREMNLLQMNPVNLAKNITAAAFFAGNEIAKDTGAADLAAAEIEKERAIAGKVVSGNRATSSRLADVETQIEATEDLKKAQIDDQLASSKRDAINKFAESTFKSAVKTGVENVADTGNPFTSSRVVTADDISNPNFKIEGIANPKVGDVYAKGVFGKNVKLDVGEYDAGIVPSLANVKSVRAPVERKVVGSTNIDYSNLGNPIV